MPCRACRQCAPTPFLVEVDVYIRIIGLLARIVVSNAIAVRWLFAYFRCRQCIHSLSIGDTWFYKTVGLLCTSYSESKHKENVPPRSQNLYREIVGHGNHTISWICDIMYLCSHMKATSLPLTKSARHEGLSMHGIMPLLACMIHIVHKFWLARQDAHMQAHGARISMTTCCNACWTRWETYNFVGLTYILLSHQG